jgi:TctA family transporter
VNAREKIMGGILWTVIVILFAFWLAGFALHIGGALIHLLLFVALVLLIVNVLTGRGARI